MRMMSESAAREDDERIGASTTLSHTTRKSNRRERAREARRRDEARAAARRADADGELVDRAQQLLVVDREERGRAARLGADRAARRLRERLVLVEVVRLQTRGTVLHSFTLAAHGRHDGCRGMR